MITLGKVEFLGGDNLYITHEAVNKLLIQNGFPITGKAKETIDLSSLESALISNKMIQDAQVYLTVNGQLEAKVKQRTPIARVLGDRNFYIDDQGRQMPLSQYHSARVPIVYGARNDEARESAYKMARFIQEDEFLKKHVVGILYENELSLQLRGQEFTVIFGKAERFMEKTNKLKAFYQKAVKDNALENYKTVNLKFDKQVVCTKK